MVDGSEAVMKGEAKKKRMMKKGEKRKRVMTEKKKGEENGEEMGNFEVEEGSIEEQREEEEGMGFF